MTLFSIYFLGLRDAQGIHRISFPVFVLRALIATAMTGLQTRTGRWGCGRGNVGTLGAVDALFSGVMCAKHQRCLAEVCCVGRLGRARGMAGAGVLAPPPSGGVSWPADKLNGIDDICGR